MAKITKAEYAEELQRLRDWIKPGDTVYTVLEHVSRSGMQRTIRVLVPYTRYRCLTCNRIIDGMRYAPRRCDQGVPSCDGTTFAAEVDHLHPNHAISVVCGYPRDAKREGVKVGGCGMDMGFALVYALSQRLYGGERCDCGRWLRTRGEGERREYYRALRPTEGTWGPRAAADRYTREAKDEADQKLPREGIDWLHEYDPDCPRCKGTGNVIGTGYQCLGKGKCPSNYHQNHRDHLHCEGVGENRCYKPDHYSSRYPVPDGWPEIEIPIGEGHTISVPAACLLDEARDQPIGICPTCKGVGTVPNPDGPERWDLEHFDGYAVRQRWL